MESKRSKRPMWEEIVRRIEQEPDIAKVAELLKELNDAMITEEREKVKYRLGIREGS